MVPFKACVRVMGIIMALACLAGIWVTVVMMHSLDTHALHGVQARSGVWREYVEGRALDLASSCSTRISPTMFRNSTNEVVVVWETTSCSLPPSVHLQPATSFRGGARTTEFPCTTTQLGPGQLVHKCVVAVTLGSPYRYRAVMGDLSSPVSDWIQFHTTGEPVQKSKFQRVKTVSVAVLGDSQSGAPEFRHNLMHIAARQPDMLLHLGDSVQDYYQLREWNEYFFGPLESTELSGTVPIVFVRGNHDGPADGPVATYTASAWYSFRTPGALWIILDASQDVPEQHVFLQSALSSAASQFIIVAIHIPPFVEYWELGAWQRGESDWGSFIRTKYVPLFEQYRVTLVLSGHSHLYQQGERNGVRYIISGGGGSPLENERVHDWGVYTNTVLAHHYGMISLTPCALLWHAYDLKNEQIDSFSIIRC